ncbi:Lariat debranching enzyme [Leucoagaricus sp. SymC.cos]|nr:Lariat debranching enzyme [Leucoagaricus sp. SymC.cos]
MLALNISFNKFIIFFTIIVTTCLIPLSYASPVTPRDAADLSADTMVKDSNVPHNAINSAQLGHGKRFDSFHRNLRTRDESDDPIVSILTITKTVRDLLEQQPQNTITASDDRLQTLQEHLSSLLRQLHDNYFELHLLVKNKIDQLTPDKRRDLAFQLVTFNEDLLVLGRATIGRKVDNESFSRDYEHCPFEVRVESPGGYSSLKQMSFFIFRTRKAADKFWRYVQEAIYSDQPDIGWDRVTHSKVQAAKIPHTRRYMPQESVYGALACRPADPLHLDNFNGQSYYIRSTIRPNLFWYYNPDKKAVEVSSQLHTKFLVRRAVPLSFECRPEDDLLIDEDDINIYVMPPEWKDDSDGQEVMIVKDSQKLLVAATRLGESRVEGGDGGNETLAPNIYFLGHAGCVRVNGVRIAGASGIFKANDFRQGNYEKLPYTSNWMRSIYHIREFNIRRLSLLSQPTIFLSHDWPQSIEHYGNLRWLLSRKSFLRPDIDSGDLGSPPLMGLLTTIKPEWWFSAHLHVRYEATVIHEPSPNQTERPGDEGQKKVENPDEIVIDDEDLDGIDSTASTTKAEPLLTTPSPAPKQNPDEITLDDEEFAVETPAAPALVPAQNQIQGPVTRFLALDKCLPKRQFLEVVDIPTSVSSDSSDSTNVQPVLEFDPEWLAITRAFHVGNLGSAGYCIWATTLAMDEILPSSSPDTRLPVRYRSETAGSVYILLATSVYCAHYQELFEFTRDNGSTLENRYYGAFNRLLTYCFQDKMFSVHPQDSPKPGSNTTQTVDFVVFLVACKSADNPVLLIEIKDDDCVRSAELRSQAD